MILEITDGRVDTLVKIRILFRMGWDVPDEKHQLPHDLGSSWDIPSRSKKDSNFYQGSRKESRRNSVFQIAFHIGWHLKKSENIYKCALMKCIFWPFQISSNVTWCKKWLKICHVVACSLLSFLLSILPNAEVLVHSEEWNTV